LSFIDDAANRLRIAASDALVEQCRDVRLKAGGSECTPLTTTAGRTSRVRTLLHIVPPDAAGGPLDNQKRMRLAYAACHRATTGEQAARLRVPFPVTGNEQAAAVWAETQAGADELAQHGERTSRNSRQEVEFVNVSLLTADILSTVCRTTLVRSAGEENPRPVEAASPGSTERPYAREPAADPNKWYETYRVLAHRKHRSRDQYLVRWKDSGGTSWVRREDLSPAALQHFYATRKGNGRDGGS
jgi:hypothetical protein